MKAVLANAGTKHLGTRIRTPIDANRISGGVPNSIADRQSSCSQKELVLTATAHVSRTRVYGLAGFVFFLLLSSSSLKAMMPNVIPAAAPLAIT